MISLRRVHSFLEKTPEQRWTTARFFATMWLARLSYAPHRVRLAVAPEERVHFWWSYFPASFSPDRGAFDYWGEDIGDLRFLWKYLRPGMTFLDIGAHHGVYSVIAAKKLGSSGRVVAFEPSPRERERLLVHLRHNGAKSVTVEPLALAEEEGKASFTIVVKGFTTMNSLRPPPINHPTEQVTVDTTTVDSYFESRQIDRVDLVKIDTEGGELAVFRGASKLLSQFRPVIVCEVLDLVTRAWGYRATEIVKALEAYGYQWFETLADGRLVRHRNRGEYPDTKNYVAVPSEKIACVLGPG